jgi:hypothetical protein
MQLFTGKFSHIEHQQQAPETSPHRNKLAGTKRRHQKNSGLHSTQAEGPNGVRILRLEEDAPVIRI